MFKVTLSYAELLALHSCVSTISCVYGEDNIRRNLLDILTNAIEVTSEQMAVSVEVES